MTTVHTMAMVIFRYRFLFLHDFEFSVSVNQFSFLRIELRAKIIDWKGARVALFQALCPTLQKQNQPPG